MESSTPKLSLKLQIVQSKYTNLSLLLNVSSLIIFFSFFILYRGRITSFAEILGIPDSITKYLIILFLFSLFGPFLAFFLEKKYDVLGILSFLPEENKIIYTEIQDVNSINFEKIERIITDLSTYKGQSSFSSLYSSGTKNYITIISDGKKLNFEVLINSIGEENILKEIIFYHTKNFR